MSRSTLYSIDPAGDVHPARDFHNAWLGAMLIWRDLPTRYGLGDDLIFRDADKVWDLARDPRVRRHHRIVMLATFDHYLCRREDFPELVAALREYGREVARDCHATMWADAIEGLLPDRLGCGWRHTSVIADPWEVDLGGDTSRRYNIHEDVGHSWLFEKLDARPARAGR